MTFKKFILYFAIAILANTIVAQEWESNSVLSTGTWYKMAIGQSGVYKVGIDDVAGLSGIEISKIAIYSMPGGQLPMNNNAEIEDDLAECNVEIVDENRNGIMDGHDYVLFYAEGASVWRYNKDHQFVELNKNSYSNYNYCYLTTSAENGKRIEMESELESGTIAMDRYTAVGIVDNDLVNTHRTGQIWVGEHFNHTTKNRSIVLDMPTMMKGENLKCYFGVAHLSTQRGQFEMRYNGIGRTITMSSDALYRTIYDSYTSKGGNQIRFDIQYTPFENMAAGYLDFIQVNAIAQLKYEGKYMDMWSNDNGTYSYTIQNCPNGLRVWDVSDMLEVRSMNVTNGKFGNEENGMHHYVAFMPSQAMRPVTINQLENQNLHGSDNVNLLIVTHPDFRNAAEELAEIHRLLDGMTVRVVTPEMVYNEFSSGRQDPIAIRRALRMMWQRWEADNTLQKPGYLLLFGRGSYDPRNILGRNKGSVVTYQSKASFDDERRSYCSDDIMGFMAPNVSGTSGDNREISIGRLPASTVAEAELMVDKIERYMTRADIAENGNSRGDWRNYVTLLADDADPSKPGDTSFTNSSEYTANTLLKKYPYLNIDKIYADAYIQQSGAIGSYYPDVNNALRNRINYGTVLLNYVGHGSVLYIGTERYMEIPDIEGYSNKDKLAFFVTSTCSFGRYDDPEVVSGAEAFLLAKNAGVGSIAASRPIGHEKLFNTKVCSNMLDPNLTVGDALRLAKNEHYAPQSITLFGDPALKLSTPKKEVVVTHINQQKVNPNIADTGLVLDKVTVAGEIRNKNGAIDENFSGTLYPIVYDRKQIGKTLANDNEGCEVTFTQQKNILYKGCDTVVNGRWEYQFIVPRDVAYQYDYGRLSHYAKSGNIDATGSYSNIVFGGFNQDADLTETRPEIDLYIGDSNFINGSLTHANPSIFAVLRDEIGINAFGSGLGHDITATLDNNPNSIIILNDFYETDLYDNHKGYINYGLRDLAPGMHTLTLKAWNIYNYSNEATINFKVISRDSIGHFYAHPNPAQYQTTINLGYSNPKEIQSVVIGIYNIQGQLVRQFTSSETYDNAILKPIVWDLKSNSGNEVNNGIYIMRAIVTTKDNCTKTETSKIIKMR